MKKLFLFFILISAAGSNSCKKAIDKKAENYILGIMTNGRWYIQQLTEGGSDISYYYYGYEFQFYENGKVDAIYGSIIESGTWTADVNNYSITTNFATSTDSLKKLNKVWKITDSYVDLVYADATEGTVAYTLQLAKKP